MSGKGKLVGADWKYAEDFRRVHVTHVFGQATDYDYRLILGFFDAIKQQRPADPSEPKAEYKVELILPFRTLKEMRGVLDEAVKQVESRVGEIKLPKHDDLPRQV